MTGGRRRPSTTAGHSWQVGGVKKVWIRLSVLANVLVLVGILYLLLGSPFRDLLHPFMTQEAVSFFAAYPVEDGDIVFVGDSITAGAQWNEMFPQHPVRNRGIGGDRTDDILRRFDQLVVGPPEKIFLKIGTNDLGTGVDEAVIVENYAEILDRFARGAPSAQIHVQSLLPREAGYRLQVERLNASLAALAAERDFVFVDLYPSFLDEDGSIRDELSPDELHLSGAGYRLWQQQLTPFVDS